MGKTVGTAGEKVEPSGDDMTATRVSAPPHTLDASEPSPAHRVERSCLASTEPLSVQAGPSGEDRIHVFLRPITPGDLSEFTKHAQTLGGGTLLRTLGSPRGRISYPRTQHRSLQLRTPASPFAVVPGHAGTPPALWSQSAPANTPMVRFAALSWSPPKARTAPSSALATLPRCTETLCAAPCRTPSADLGASGAHFRTIIVGILETIQ